MQSVLSTKACGSIDRYAAAHFLSLFVAVDSFSSHYSSHTGTLTCVFQIQRPHFPYLLSKSVSSTFYSSFLKI